MRKQVSDYLTVAKIYVPTGSVTIYPSADMSDMQKKSFINSLNLISGDSASYGKAYAMRSGNCFRCNRFLTNPESIETGIGPECRKKI